MQGFLAEVLSKYRGSGEAAGRGGRVYVIAALVQPGAASLVLASRVVLGRVHVARLYVLLVPHAVQVRPV